MEENLSIWLDLYNPNLVSEAIALGVKNFRGHPAVVERLQQYPRKSYRIFDIVKPGDDPAECDCCILELTEAEARDIREVNHQLQRIRELALVGVFFSGKTETFAALLAGCKENLDFCAFPLNYIDWTLRDALGMCAIAGKMNLPVLAFDPTKHGLLEDPGREELQELQRQRPGHSALSWCYSWLRTSRRAEAALISCQTREELKDNLQALEDGQALSPDKECTAIYVAGRIRHMEDAPPCTGCGHCDGVCPVSLDIHYLIGMYTDLSMFPDPIRLREYQMLPPEERGSACRKCWQCVASCPKGIPVPVVLAELEEMLRAVNPPCSEIAQSSEAEKVGDSR